MAKKNKVASDESTSWALKYRPKSLDDLIGQQTVVTGLKSALSLNSLQHMLIFSGQRGCGKTTTARIISKEVGASGLDVVEIDAASSSGVDNIRMLLETSTLMPIESKSKVFILDECHMLSKSASNALLKSLEEPSSSVYWILCTTEVDNIIPTILSRGARYSFNSVDTATLSQYIKLISTKEGFEVLPDICDLVARKSNGSVRDAVKDVQIICTSGFANDMGEASRILTRADEEFVLSIVRALLSGDVYTVIDSSLLIQANKYDFGSVLDDVCEKIRFIFLLKLFSGKSNLDDVKWYYNFVKQSVELKEFVKLVAKDGTVKDRMVYEAGLLRMMYA